MPSRKKTIFIVYARFGEGHLQAANALQASFESLGMNVRLVDLLAESHPYLNEISRFVYRKSYHILPQVYGWVYEATRHMKSDSLFSHFLHSFGAATLRKLIERERPDAIIHTFPMLVLPALSSRYRMNIPMYNVVTDFDLHQRWLHPSVDMYYVATEDMRSQMGKLGIAPDRVAATGIPIRSAFRAVRGDEGDSTSPRKPVVLVMAAAMGSAADTAKLCRRLTEECAAEAVVVCGRDRTLQRSLQTALGNRPDISVHGYIQRMEGLMAEAACIITKPGGLTLSEAMTARLPLFLYRPVAGQERCNARYLAAKGAAVVSRTPGELTAAVKRLLTDPAVRFHMLDAIDTLRREGASDRIALDIARRLNIMEVAFISEAR